MNKVIHLLLICVILCLPTQCVNAGNEWITAENTSSEIYYNANGGWGVWEEQNDSGGSSSVSNNVVGNYVQFSFYGTAIEYISRKHPLLGIVEIYIDNESQGSYDLCLNNWYTYKQVIFSKTGLKRGNHTIKIVLIGKSPENEDGLRLMVDAFRYTDENVTLKSVKVIDNQVGVRIENMSNTDNMPLILVANYNNNRLVSIDEKPVVYNQNNYFFPYNPNTRVKVFLWSNNKKLTPMSVAKAPSGVMELSKENTYKRWQCQEFILYSEKSYNESEKPWNYVPVSASFKTEGENEIKINGFWDGDNRFKIRFTPTLPGKWEMFVTSSDAYMNGCFTALNIENTSAGETNPIYLHGGFLKTSSSGRYLTYTDGTPFYYLAETLWYAPSDEYMPIDQPASAYSTNAMGANFFKQKGITSAFNYVLDDRQNKGFSVIRTGFLGKNQNVCIQQEYHKTGNINLNYWNMADKYFKSISEHGMIQIAFPIWQGEESGWANLSEWKELLNYMTARYGAYPLTFGMAPEYNNDIKCKNGTAKMALEALSYFKQNDPYKRSLTIQPNPWNLMGNADKMEWNESYVDFLMIEGGHENPYGVSENYYREAWEHKKGGQSMPYVNVETTWDGIMRNEYPMYDDYVIRFNQYRAWLMGGRGVDYGTQGLWYPVQHYSDKTFEDSWGNTNIPWWDAINKPSSNQMGYMRNIMENLSWWEMEPLFYAAEANDIILPPPNGNAPAPQREYKKIVVSTIRQGQEFIIYIPKTLNLTTKLAFNYKEGTKTEYSAKWVNPSTGQSFVPVQTVKRDNGTVVLPDRPSTEDWVLILK